MVKNVYCCHFQTEILNDYRDLMKSIRVQPRLRKGCEEFHFRSFNSEKISSKQSDVPDGSAAILTSY